MRFDAPKFEKLLVLLIILHSLGVGIMLFLFPGWSVRFGGWSEVTLLFFVRQSGIFHLVLAFGYWNEYTRYGGVTLLISAKTIAFVFLMSVSLFVVMPWAVWMSGIADGLMGLMVLLVHRHAVSADETSSKTSST
ncbi:hypothetical protein JXA40_08040 [bacterium]|nr:hypothetical protein [candidate division CSSED10-310 bacterium]